MKRILFIIILLLVMAVMVLVWAWPAQAVTYAGGTEEQRAYAREVIESCWFDYQWTDANVDEVDLIIAEHYDPYWDLAVFDQETGVAGLAWRGNIVVKASYQPGYGSFFGEIVAHEWCHQIWFAMPYAWKEEWTRLCTEGITDYNPDDWLTMPAENFAECMRVALFDSKYLYYQYPRTDLWPMNPDFSRRFVCAFRWSGESPFTDIQSEDWELRGAAGYLYANGVMLGYPDSTIGPYKPLLKRHVALICERVGLPCTFSVDDYSPALRSDVRDNIPDLEWLETRWDEQITRGQLMRLVFREEVD